jgi:hypothetical protein
LCFALLANDISGGPGIERSTIIWRVFEVGLDEAQRSRRGEDTAMKGKADSKDEFELVSRVEAHHFVH